MLTLHERITIFFAQLFHNEFVYYFIRNYTITTKYQHADLCFNAIQTKTIVWSVHVTMFV
jgi:hypothetical protein